MAARNSASTVTGWPSLRVADWAATRDTLQLSGRPAPPHPGGAPNCGDWVMVEGYSRELSSCGFWPGGGEEGAFYAYASPNPTASPTTPSARPRPSTAPTTASFWCPTRPSAPRPTRTGH